MTKTATRTKKAKTSTRKVSNDSDTYHPGYVHKLLLQRSSTAGLKSQQSGKSSGASKGTVEVLRDVRTSFISLHSLALTNNPLATQRRVKVVDYRRRREGMGRLRRSAPGPINQRSNTRQGCKAAGQTAMGPSQGPSNSTPTVKGDLGLAGRG
jgi:hypothetical protein